MRPWAEVSNVQLADLHFQCAVEGGFFRPLSLDRKNLGYLTYKLTRKHKVGNPIDVKFTF